MANLPNSYLQTRNRVPEYFQAILNAEPPDRFSQRFLENIGFKAKNDRLLIGILKELRFIDADSKPLPRYYEFLDRSQWKRVLADGIREAYSGLFSISKNAHSLDSSEVYNKLRTLYAGQKSDNTINLIAKTFESLAEIAEFSSSPSTQNNIKSEDNLDGNVEPDESEIAEADSITTGLKKERPISKEKIRVRSLQYHINIVLPESRDQAVYDAIFKSLREHLG